MPQPGRPPNGDALPWFPVLMYHRVVPRLDTPDPLRLCVTTRQFQAQMRYLAAHGYQVLPLDTLADALDRDVPPGPRQVAITFDDGYRDVYLHALPLLRAHGFPATVFLVSAALSGANLWDRGRAPEAPLLGLDELADMARQGVAFGSHSVTHRSLVELGPRSVLEEIVASRERLERVLGMPVRTFSYPYGRSTPAVRDMVRQAGYVAACGIEQREHSRYNLSRVDAAACAGADLRWRWRVSGAYFRLRQSRLLRRLKALL